MVVLTDITETSSSSNHHHELYDVFISFRGADTRLNFTNHLHKALESANLKTFLDDKEIETGEYLKPELEIAIKASRASVIVLSTNYASSTWCLDELVLILEQHKDFDQIVIPIFYHVEPTDVRKQQKSFKDAMEIHERRMEAEGDVEKKGQLAEKIKIWKEALTQVADLKGIDAKDRQETEFIKEIIDDIYRRLRVPIRTTLPLLIGMDSYIDVITSWLKDDSSHNVDILTILGISGIGKTALADYVYKLHHRKFDASSFVEDISRTCAQFNGMLGLQKQLLGDILKTSPVQVHRVSEYTSNIENALSHQKVFLVLDDVDSIDQLDELLGHKGLHPGSKIIITAKNATLTESCALFNLQVQPKHTKHLLNGLYDESSQKLLFLHAFKSEKVKEGYEEVSDNIVKYCGGHPLALKVLGSSLNKKDVAYWEECVHELKQGPFSRINNILRMSFESLEKNEKELFKHIACFFVGIDRYIAEMILKACKINTISGITNLVDRCLLHIDRNNELKMHSLIQVIGRDAVHQESPDKPEERSRLWRHKESYKVLKKKTGTIKIDGLALDMTMIEKEKLLGSLFELETDALTKMEDLKLLQLNYIQLNGSYEKFPKKLRWLCMQWYPLESMPLDLPMKKLVALDMSYSNLKSFDMSSSNQQRPGKRLKVNVSCSKDTPLLGSLKILDLSFCKLLRSLGGFFEIPALERLMVSNCMSLIDICESIEQCIELVLIDLNYCKKLEKLPRSLGKLTKAKTLLLRGHESQYDKDSLEMIKVNSIGINSQTSSSAIVNAIPRNLKSLAVSFPSSLTSLSLAYNGLSFDSFPEDLSILSMLKELTLDGNPIVSMPNCVRTIPRLEHLGMSYCEMLTSIEQPPCTLRWLEYNSPAKPLLRKISFDPNIMYPLMLILSMQKLASSSIEIEGLVKLQPMEDVEEKALRSLGWSNLEFTKNRRIGTYNIISRELERSRTQMYYEFGIFSTFYRGEEMPNWITQTSLEESISFTIPSSPNNLTGLNFCYVLFKRERSLYPGCFLLSVIIICNETKNRTWIYNHYANKNLLGVGGECLTFISHWMFGINDMEVGDHVTIYVEEEEDQFTGGCGVSFLYGDESMEEKEEDILSYYKSWDRIIGCNLSPFQLPTGEYLLDIREFHSQMHKMDTISPCISICPFYKGKDMRFFKGPWLERLLAKPYIKSYNTR